MQLLKKCIVFTLFLLRARKGCKLCSRIDGLANQSNGTEARDLEEKNYDFISDITNPLWKWRFPTRRFSLQAESAFPPYYIAQKLQNQIVNSNYQFNLITPKQIFLNALLVMETHAKKRSVIVTRWNGKIVRGCKFMSNIELNQYFANSLLSGQSSITFQASSSSAASTPVTRISQKRFEIIRGEIKR